MRGASDVERIIVNHRDKNLLDSAQSGNLDEINALLDDGARINYEDFSGCTPLLLATRAGHHKAVQLLIARGADCNWKDKDNGFCALVWATTSGQIVVMKKLLKAGARTEDVDHHGWTPLCWAATQGRTEAVELLLSYKANVNACNKKLQTPLHLAAENDHLVTTKKIVKTKKVNFSLVDINGNKAWEVARGQSRAYLVKLIAKKKLNRGSGGQNNHQRAPTYRDEGRSSFQSHEGAALYSDHNDVAAMLQDAPLLNHAGEEMMEDRMSQASMQEFNLERSLARASVESQEQAERDRRRGKHYRGVKKTSFIVVEGAGYANKKRISELRAKDKALAAPSESSAGGDSVSPTPCLSNTTSPMPVSPVEFSPLYKQDNDDDVMGGASSIASADCRQRQLSNNSHRLEASRNLHLNQYQRRDDDVEEEEHIDNAAAARRRSSEQQQQQQQQQQQRSSLEYQSRRSQQFQSQQSQQRQVIPPLQLQEPRQVSKKKSDTEINLLAAQIKAAEAKADVAEMKLAQVQKALEKEQQQGKVCKYGHLSSSLVLLLADRLKHKNEAKHQLVNDQVAQMHTNDVHLADFKVISLVGVKDTHNACDVQMVEYLAEYKRTGEMYSLKFLAPYHFEQDQLSRDQIFANECNAFDARHTGIASTLAKFVDTIVPTKMPQWPFEDRTAYSSPCIIKELWKNSLHAISKHAAFTEQDILLIVSQLLFSLRHLSAKNIVHRDICIHSVRAKYVDGNLRVCLSDFATSYSCSDLSRVEVKKLLKRESGDPYCRAPELYHLERHIQGATVDLTKSDIWSIGLLMYELAAPSLARKITPTTVSDATLPYKIPNMSPEFVQLANSFLSRNPRLRINLPEATMATRLLLYGPSIKVLQSAQDPPKPMLEYWRDIVTQDSTVTNESFLQDIASVKKVNMELTRKAIVFITPTNVSCRSSSSSSCI